MGVGWREIEGMVVDGDSWMMTFIPRNADREGLSNESLRVARVQGFGRNYTYMHRSCGAL